MQNEVNIKLNDYNAEKAYRLAKLLDKTLIINVDGRNNEAMLEEGLPNMDAFLAVTGDVYKRQDVRNSRDCRSAM